MFAGNMRVRAQPHAVKGRERTPLHAYLGCGFLPYGMTLEDRFATPSVSEL